MRKHIIILITIFAFHCITNKLCGQITTTKGFVVTNSGDTIHGWLEYVKSGYKNKCIFIKPSGEVELYNPTDIQQFFVDRVINFRSMMFDGKLTFVQVISTGKINLYYNGKDLFLENDQQILKKLRGGKEIVMNNGKEYVNDVSLYKSQLKAYAEPVYHNRINALYFQKKAIIRLVKEINDHKDNYQIPKSKILNRNHFGIESGFTINSMRIWFIPYRHNSTTIEEDPWFTSGISSKSQITSSMIAGVNYKRKIGRTRSYVDVHLNYENILKNTILNRWAYHSMVVPANGASYSGDTILLVTDTYKYNLQALSFPLNLHTELSFGKFRPFWNIGVTTKFFVKNDIVLNRKGYRTKTGEVEESSIKLDMPSFIIGPEMGFGCRYPMNMNSSISMGLHAAFYGIRNSKNIDRMIVSKFFIAYGF